MKEMSPLEEIRHSTAHVLAAAVLRLYPNTQLDIGPPTDNGFYYDFDSDMAFTPEIIDEIEVEMKKIIKENNDFSAGVFFGENFWSRAAAAETGLRTGGTLWAADGDL